MMYVTLVKPSIKLEIILPALVKIHRCQLIVMLDSLFCGGIMSVILSRIIMHKRSQKIQLIRGLISVGKRGGTLLYDDRMGIIEAYYVTLFWKNLIWICFFGQMIAHTGNQHGF